MASRKLNRANQRKVDALAKRTAKVAVRCLDLLRVKPRTLDEVRAKVPPEQRSLVQDALTSMLRMGAVELVGKRWRIGKLRPGVAPKRPEET